MCDTSNKNASEHSNRWKDVKVSCGRELSKAFAAFMEQFTAACLLSATNTGLTVIWWRFGGIMQLSLLRCGLFVRLCHLCGKHPSSSVLVWAHVKRAVSGLQEVWDVNRPGNELQTTLGRNVCYKELVEGFPLCWSYTNDKQQLFDLLNTGDATWMICYMWKDHHRSWCLG